MTTRDSLFQHIDDATPGDEVLDRAVADAAELGADHVDAATGALLCATAVMVRASAVAVVSPSPGVTGLWLLRGMRGDGILTSIDIEPEHQSVARQAFTAEGIPPSRTRLITGIPLEVLPRLADDAYDLVVLQVPTSELPQHLEQGIRLLRPGGALIVPDALLDGTVGDHTRHDQETVAAREAERLVAEDDELVVSRIPLGRGLLLAVRRAAD